MLFIQPEAMKRICVITFCLLLAAASKAQVDVASKLYVEIRANDSLLFSVGFNTCDISQFELLLSEDFEFYHDKAGITSSKQEFINSIANGLCKMTYKALRELDEQSMQVFPLMKNGELYGAIQSGTHRFYAVEAGKQAVLTNIARYTHVWLLENGQWKLARGLSFDHQDPEPAVK